MPQQNSLIRRLGDRAARALWSGDVADGTTVVDTASAPTYRRNQWQATAVGLSKAESGLRRGTVPEHIESPHKGRPRSYNPLSLRKLANSAAVQLNISAILGDFRDVPWSVVPMDDETTVSQSVLDEAERALADPNPNPESFDDVNAMLARDLLEVGNCVGVTSLQIDGRRAEAVPYDPNTFTADWDDNRILQKFWQYPRANQRWGNPEEFDRDVVLWGVFQPTITRAGIYGFSPVEVVAQFINIMGGLVEKEIKELEEGMPSGLIALVGDEWSSANYQNFKTYWKEEVKGEQMKHPIAEGDAKFEPFNMTYKELQVLDRQKWYSKLVGAAFRTPVSETGLAIGQEMTRATDVSQRQKYKKRALGAVITQIEELWTRQYLHRWYSENIRLKFDPGRDLMEKREIAETNKIELESGVITPNEIREERGLDEVPWGDKPLALQTGRGVGDVLDAGAPAGVLGDEQANQSALDEGLRQDSTPTNDGGNPADFSDGGDGTAAAKGYDALDGTWLPANAPAASKKLRETDADEKFHFSDAEVESLREDIEGVYRDAIQDIRNKIKGNQQLLRRPTEDRPGKSIEDVAAQKNVPSLMQLTKAELGISFAEDVRDILVRYKVEKVTDGEETILSELRQAGLTVEDIELEPVRDRVVSRIRTQTLSVTRPISRRLERDFREIIETAWREGQRITEVEAAIEDLSDKWLGHSAETLARTELGRAAKSGRLAYAKETSDEVGGWAKTWLSTHDHRTRTAHRKMDGRTVPVDESWTVDYSDPDSEGPPAVSEQYPGASVWGINCRCDYSLAPAAVVAKANEWAADSSARMNEVANEQERPIDAVMLGAELGPESRTAAAKRLGLSKSTYYRWIRDAGLDNPAATTARAAASKAAKYGEGDVVTYGDGKTGVVLEAHSSDFETPDEAGNPIEVPSDVTKYVVGRESGGFGIYTEDELSDGSFPDDVPGDPEELAEEANQPAASKRFYPEPEGWTRLSYLKAYASLGGSFSSCQRRMTGEVRDAAGWCAELKDTVYGTTYWR